MSMLGNMSKDVVENYIIQCTPKEKVSKWTLSEPIHPMTKVTGWIGIIKKFPFDLSGNFSLEAFFMMFLKKTIQLA